MKYFVQASRTSRITEQGPMITERALSSVRNSLLDEFASFLEQDVLKVDEITGKLRTDENMITKLAIRYYRTVS